MSIGDAFPRRCVNKRRPPPTTTSRPSYNIPNVHWPWESASLATPRFAEHVLGFDAARTEVVWEHLGSFLYVSFTIFDEPSPGPVFSSYLAQDETRGMLSMSFPPEMSWLSVFPVIPIASLVAGVGFLVYLRYFYVDLPPIEGIPEVPNGELLAGHFYKLGNDHATTAESWAQKYGWPVFQVRMGRRRAVILNSFDSAREWTVKNQSATLDRPWFYTFHGIVSATSAATIGTSPWDERTKKQRRVVGSFTTGPSMRDMRPMLDLETCAMVSAIYYDSEKGDAEVSPHIYQKRLALNLMTMFCYGTRFSSIKDPLLGQILSDANTIASFRSTKANPQDFIPHLRYMGGNARNQTAMEVRKRRDTWLSTMLENIRGSLPMKLGSKKMNVAEMLLTDSQEGLTQMDIKTILGGLMSGGFETIFSTVIITIGMLSTPAGQVMQQKAYDDIMSVYDSPEEAFEQCLNEEKSLYVAGLVKEALRFYPPLKLLPARQTYKEFIYQGAVIPKGLLLYVNAQAANRDKSVYGPDAGEFHPERWLEGGPEVPPPYHFAFGAGARMCTAVNFSNRMLYAIFLRLIVAFKIEPSKTMPANTHYINYKEDAAASNAVASDFRIRLTPRDQQSLERCFERSEELSEGATSSQYSEPLKK